MTWFHDPYWLEALEVAIALSPGHRRVFVPAEWVGFAPNFVPIQFSEGENPADCAFVVVHENVDWLSERFREAFDFVLTPTFANEVFTAAAATPPIRTFRVVESGRRSFKERMAQVSAGEMIGLPRYNKRLSRSGPKPIVLLNANAMGNVGDELMAGLAATWIGRIAPNNGLKVAEFDISRRDLETASFLVIGGGGFLFDVQRSYCDLGNLANCFSPLLVARAKGVSSAVISLGSQGLVSDFAKGFAARALGAAHMVTARDCETRDLVNQISGGRTQAVLAPDMVFALCSEQSAPPSRPVKHLVISGEISRYGPAFLDALATTLASYSGLQITFAVMASEDLALARKLRDRLNEHVRSFEIDTMNDDNPDALVSLYARADGVITGRLHGLVLALLHRRPVVALDYPGGKKQRLIEDFFPSVRDGLVLAHYQSPLALARCVDALVLGNGLAPTQPEWERARREALKHYEVLEISLRAAGVDEL